MHLINHSKDMQHTRCWALLLLPTGIDHFDLSFWAFEQLAHPLYGQMMLEYRPVSCETRAPVPYNPGYISKTDIYQGGTKAGWNWFPYFAAYSKYEVPGVCVDSSWYL